MTTYVRTRPQILLAKVESSEGTDASPSGGSNAIRVENVNWNETPTIIQSNEVSGALDVSPPISGGVKTVVTFDAWTKARSAGETPPELGVLLKGCGMVETITSTAVPSSAEACGAGGSTTTAVLGSSATGTADLYNGMPINFTGTVALAAFVADYAANKTATITDTAGASIVATTSYQIPKNVVYRFASSSLASLTLYLYRDGKLYKGVGARGTFTMQWVSGEGIKFSFTFMAVWAQVTDTALTTPSYTDAAKLVWRGLSGGLARARWNRILVQPKTLTFDCGNTVVHPDNPEGTEGYDPAQITLRGAKITLDPLETLVATRDVKADMRANTTRIVHARAYTGSAGGGIAVTAANAQAVAQGDGDRDGFAVEQIQAQATGDNDAFSIAFW